MTKDTKPEDALVEEAVLSDDPETHVVEDTLDEVEAAPAEVEDNLDSSPIEPSDAQVVVQKRGGVSVILGGILAAGVGFAVAQFVPDGWPLAGANTDELEAQLQQQSDQIVQLQGQFEKQSASIATKVEEAKLADEIAVQSLLSEKLTADNQTAIDQVLTRVDELSTRVTEAEKRPISENANSRAAAAAYERELGELRKTLEAQKAEVEASSKEAEEKIALAQSQAEDLQASATATANAALIRAGLTKIDAAIENGAPFSAALSEVSGASDVAPSESLLAAASNGVATHADLRNNFPDAARTALAAAGAETQADGTLNRLGEFLRGQTGARSLSPREGSGSDAILSRAEAAVGANDLALALEEIASLPPAAQDEMSSWLKLASDRLETVKAVEAFSTSIEKQ